MEKAMLEQLNAYMTTLNYYQAIFWPTEKIPH